MDELDPMFPTIYMKVCLAFEKNNDIQITEVTSFHFNTLLESH